MSPQISKQTKNPYDFTLRLIGPDVTDEENFDALARATKDAATFRRQGGLQFADFTREAPSFPEAVIPAIRQLDGALPGLRVTAVEPEDLVHASEIAQRIGRSRQSISQLIKGQRGSNDFPPPVALANTKSPLWSWSEVSRWFAEQDENADITEELLIAEFVAELNGLLEAREHKLRRKDVLREVRRQQGRAARRKARSRLLIRRRRRDAKPAVAIAAYANDGLLGSLD